MMRWLDKNKDKEKDKEKEKEKEKDKEREKENAKQREKERKEDKEREKDKKKLNGSGNLNKSDKHVDMGGVDWEEARGNLKRRSNSFVNESAKKPNFISPKKRGATYGRNSVSLVDLHSQREREKEREKGPIKSPSAKGGIGADARSAKQKQKEKDFLESIAAHSQQDKPSAFAIASESYKLRIVELEDEAQIANKRVISLTDRIHMLEAEIRAANEHHTRTNSVLQEKLANVETDNAVLKNQLKISESKCVELQARLDAAENHVDDHNGDGGEESGDGKRVIENGKDLELAPVSPRVQNSQSISKSATLAPPTVKSHTLTQSGGADKSGESVLRQRIQVLESELSTKTNDMAVMKLQVSNLEPQVKTLTQDLEKAKYNVSESGDLVSGVVEILGEWQAATESTDADLRDYLADESELPPVEEVRRLNKKVLLLRERVSGADQIIYRIAKTVGVNSVRLDLGVIKADPTKDSNQSHANSNRQLRSNSVGERDAALSIKLAVATMGTEPAVQKLVKGIFLNTVRSVNLGGLVLPTEIIQSLSKALLVSTTVLSVLFPNTLLGDAGATFIAEAMRGNSSITNLNMEECGLGDAGVKDLAQALAANKKAVLASLNLSHNRFGVQGSQSLATFLENNHTLTKLDLGYSHLGSASAPFIAQVLKNPKVALSHLFVPGNDFLDEGATKFAEALSSNTKLRVFNFQGNKMGQKVAAQFAASLAKCQIHTLDLSRNPIGPEGAQAVAVTLKSNNAIKELSLISCAIQPQGAAHLAEALHHNNSLTALHLWGNHLGLVGLSAFASKDKKLGALKVLDIRGNEFPAAAGQELGILLSKKSHLSSLDLSGNALGPKGCELLSKPLSSASLTSLFLSANSLGNEGAKNISKSLGPSLTSLCLSLNFLGDDAMDYLAPRLCAPSHITHLDLSWNHIGAGGARELSKILEKPNCPITTLNLEGNSLGPEGTVQLAASLHSNSTLTHLNITANNFRKDGAKAIADLLKKSPTITTLLIGKNGIKDDGALALSNALKTNTSIAHLDLSENRIENQGIHSLSEALKLNSSLMSINLSHNPFDKSGVQSLAQAHVRNPKVYVSISSS